MASEDFVFQKARPVFLKGMAEEKNVMAAFRAVFHPQPQEDWTLRIAGSSAYRIWLNGRFAGYGPARAAHGFYRADEIPLGPLLSRADENVLVIEVAGYNAGGYYLLDQPSFLQAEVCREGCPVLYTASGEGGFAAWRIIQRMQRVQRFSFQRPFVEVYHLDGAYDAWKVGGGAEAVRETAGATVEEVEEKRLIARGIPLPFFALWPVERVAARGRVQYGQQPDRPFRDRSLTEISDICKGFPQAELECCLSEEVQSIACLPAARESPWTGEAQVDQDGFLLLDFGKNKSGFLGLTLECRERCRLYLVFDEVLCGGDIDFMRSGWCCPAMRLDLEPGTHVWESFEPYTMRYLKIITAGGGCRIQEAYIRRYETGVPLLPFPPLADEEIACIYEAAADTFRQNAVDLLTDCPSRERAGWLCDTFFTARAERQLTGGNAVEENFLENYALPASFPFLPQGMVPMRYPADDDERVFIPNWAMWLILELLDYRSRGGGPELIQALQPRVQGILDYLAPFENEYGLLERLDGWVFVEWSKANELVQDVSFPTNMLYARALRDAGLLYGNREWLEKAERVADSVNRWSYNGVFYVDNARRTPDGLHPTGECTEVCQYYAFFTGVASPDSRPELWEILLRDFGPERREKDRYPAVYPANAFIGNYLRMELLFQNGLEEQLLREIKGYFLNMARRTGTLWEYDTEVASCCHGFTSVLAYWIGAIVESDRWREEL